MEPEVIEAFRKNFEELRSEHESITKKVKYNAIQEINALLESDKFDESKKGVDYLNQLLEEIKFDFNFDKVEASLNQYNENFTNLKTGGTLQNVNKTIEANISAKEEPKTREVTSTQAFSPNDNPDASISEGNFLNYLKQKFSEHQFNFVSSNNDDIELEKNNRHIYLTLDKSEFGKNDYFNLLEKMNEKKNIGFICDSESSLVNLKKIAAEWVQISPEHKTKFLTINLTTKSRLDSKTNDLFEVVRNTN